MAMSQRRWKLEQERKRRERLRRARRRRNCAIVVLLMAVVAVIAIVILNSNGTNRKASPTPAQTAQNNAVSDTTVVNDPYKTNRSEEDIKASFYSESAFAGNALAETIGMYGLLKDTDFYAGVNVDLENVYTITTQGSTTSVSEQFKSRRFNKIFLSFGENELKTLKKSEFKKSYKKFIEKIQEYQPNARIYLFAIPPVTAKASEQSKDITMEKITDFNQAILSLAVDNEIYYIDSVDALGDNKGYLPKGVSVDGINLNKDAVIDLLYYASKEAYIPSAEDLTELSADDDTEEDEDADDETKTTAQPAETDKASPSPSPTVNVFKDSKTDTKNRKGNE